MQKLLCAVILFTLPGCTSKKWDKETLVNDCLRDFTKRNEEEKVFTTMQLANLCDCVSEKFLVKYNSAGEAEKDEEGSRQIGSDCATEVMEK